MGKTFESLITLTQVADGAQGPAADEYRVETNQEEILKFREGDSELGGWEFSPEVLSFTPYRKDESILNSSDIDFKIIVYSTTDRKEFEIPYSLGVDGETDSNYKLISINEERGKYNFDLKVLSSLYYNTFEENTDGAWLKNVVEQDCFVVGFNCYENEKLICQKLVPCRNGMSRDMATFSLETQKIVAAIQNGRMEFSSEGLTLTNGSFSIIKESDDGSISLLGTDDDGNLFITGTINATNGEFNGTINANSGKIGGFTISETELVSEDGGIKLQGADGKIIANNIELGTGAVIKKYIQLGDAFLYNPLDEENGGKVISASGFSLLQDGHLNLGSIEMYGGDEANVSYIKTDSWEISGDGQAVFKDIYADNVHLLNTIMEIGTVQNVGSLMIFKDAWAPIEIIDKTLRFDKETSLNEGDWVYNGTSYYQVSTVTEDKKECTLTTTYGENIEKPISKFGSTNDFVFSIFGESGNSKVSDSKFPFASPYSITLSSFIEKGEVLEFNKKLVLGKLDESGVDASGIGLYCDNVFLEGSLIAKQLDNQTTYYSGINTLSNIVMPKGLKDEMGNFTTLYYPLPDDPTQSRPVGKILLWAGAKSKGEADIQEAPFRVDSLGNFYAGSGYFKGSIISEATITAATMEAARIRTAILEGWDTENYGWAALKIINADKGIGFYKGTGAENDKEIFTIGNSGLRANGIDFIKIDEKGKISNKIISSSDAARKEFVSEFGENGLELTVYDITADSNVTNYSFNIGNEISIKKAYNKLITIETDTSTYETDMVFNQNISYSDVMRYEKVEGAGYDLFIENQEDGQ